MKFSHIGYGVEIAIEYALVDYSKFKMTRPSPFSLTKLKHISTNKQIIKKKLIYKRLTKYMNFNKVPYLFNDHPNIAMETQMIFFRKL